MEWVRITSSSTNKTKLPHLLPLVKGQSGAGCGQGGKMTTGDFSQNSLQWSGCWQGMLWWGASFPQGRLGTAEKGVCKTWFIPCQPSICWWDFSGYCYSGNQAGINSEAESSFSSRCCGAQTLFWFMSLAHWCLTDMRRWSGTSSCDLVNSPLCVGLRVWTSQPLCGYSSFFAYPLLCVPLTHSCLLNSGVLPDSVGEVLPYLPLQLLNHRPISPDPLSCPVLPYLHYTVHKVPSISLCYFPELFSWLIFVCFGYIHGGLRRREYRWQSEDASCSSKMATL